MCNFLHTKPQGTFRLCIFNMCQNESRDIQQHKKMAKKKRPFFTSEVETYFFLSLFCISISTVAEFRENWLGGEKAKHEKTYTPWR